jgi:PAS domain S-box-containing protein
MASELEFPDARRAPLMSFSALGEVGKSRGPATPGSPPGFEEPDFSGTFEQVAIGMAVVAPDSTWLRINRAFCDMLGHTRLEMVSLTLRDVTHPGDVADHDDLCARMLAGELDSSQREKRYLHKSGRLIWVQQTCSLVRHLDGEPAHFLVQALDITERKAAEQGLRQSQALLHLAAQIGRLGAWSYDLSESRMVWSEDLCAILGVTRGYRPTPNQAIEFFAPEQRETVRTTFHACLRDGSPFDVEAPVITAKGRQLWTRVIGEAEWDAQGRVRRINGAWQDISEARAVADAAIAMAEQLETTLESMTDAFFTIDRDWRFTYLNSEAERAFRASRDELLGKSLGEVLPGTLGLPFQRHLARAMSDQVVVQCEEFCAPDGAWIQLKAYPSRQGLAIYVKDITEQVAAQQEILRLNAELGNRIDERTAQLEAANHDLSIANKELEAFSYSVAHDLRAPLGAIAAFSQILESAVGHTLPDRNRNHLNRIVALARRMDEIIESLISLAKLSRASLRRVPVDLAELARAALEVCRESAPGRQVDIQIAPTLPVLGDPGLLAEVIGNLVGNAWKFTSKRDGARIEVGNVAGAAEQPVYFVRDNGAGFDMSHASKLFGAFQRLHAACEFEGSGIGLAIVKKIIGRHGGRIWAESEPGRGATFYFVLNSSAESRPSQFSTL